MLWVRRAVFLLLFIIITSGYYVYKKTTAYYEQKEAEKYAAVTAQIWVATARYNENPERYRQYRDSLLNAEKTGKDELNSYLNTYKSSPEKYLLFVTAVNFKIDSIAKLQSQQIDSTGQLPADSVIQIN